MSEGLTLVKERAADGGPVLRTEDEEDIKHTQPNVAIVLGDSKKEDIGTLYITTRRLVWLDQHDQQHGYAVDFFSMSMHAISRDADAYPRPCIYTQIESDAMDEGIEKEGEEEEEDEPIDEAGAEAKDLALVSEMRLVPEDSSVLDRLFHVLCECAALNPDPGAEDDEGNFFYNSEEVNGCSDRAAMLSHLDGLLQVPADQQNELEQDPQQFEDAEEEEFEDEAENNGHHSL